MYIKTGPDGIRKSFSMQLNIKLSQHLLIIIKLYTHAYNEEFLPTSFNETVSILIPEIDKKM